MQYFLLSVSTDNELRRLVDCRKYLQFTTLVNITSADGKVIMLQSWQGKYITGRNYPVHGQDNIHADIWIEKFDNKC